MERKITPIPENYTLNETSRLWLPDYYLSDKYPVNGHAKVVAEQVNVDQPKPETRAQTEAYGNLYVQEAPETIEHEGKIFNLSPADRIFNQMINPVNVQRLKQIYGSLQNQMTEEGASPQKISEMRRDLLDNYLTARSRYNRVLASTPRQVSEIVYGLLGLPDEELNKLAYGETEKLEKVEPKETEETPKETEEAPKETEEAPKETEEVIAPTMEVVPFVEEVEPVLGITEPIVEDKTPSKAQKSSVSDDEPTEPTETLEELVSKPDQIAITTDIEGTKEFPAQEVLDDILLALYEIDDPEEQNVRLNNALAVLEGVQHPAEAELQSAHEDISSLSANLVQASHEIYRLTSETEKLEGQRDSARKFAEELMGTIRKEKIKRTTRYIMNMDLLNPALKKIIDDRIEASSDDE